MVDGVVTDGAAWNRSMWTKFGVTKEKCSVEHPCDPQRKLFFISDFPHFLMKCMRNCLCKKKNIHTPNGDVQLRHWEAVLEAEKLHKLGLRECHKLTQEHLNPDPWQKMNVAMAWQFWSGSVAAAMESYRFQEVDKLADCDASIEMCTLINNLTDAMNSNRPENALRLGSAHFKKFLHYFTNLREWADNKLRIKLEEAEKSRIAQLRAQGKTPKGKAIKYQEDYIFSDSTDIGFIVTLKGTLELVNFLVQKCGYAYVMTARLNQDALERFFGLVRQSCGRNTHPEPRVFAQLFRLLSIYSLVKPCRGSNITGGEMVTALFSLEDMKAKTRQERHTVHGIGALRDVEDDEDSGEGEEEDLDKDEVEIVDLAEEIEKNDMLWLPTHRRCASHTLSRIAVRDVESLIANDASLKSLHDSIMAKCKALWRSQARSTMGHDKIKVVLGTLLPTPNETRWNSKFDALTHITKTD
ncbi:hypothetical protein FOCC_FOCC007316 [Frankliniella occidentalis]|nr:hypothetical protein FOCC_FOCC007316 [Frankliniella occidentalis]